MSNLHQVTNKLQSNTLLRRLLHVGSATIVVALPSFDGLHKGNEICYARVFCDRPGT